MSAPPPGMESGNRPEGTWTGPVDELVDVPCVGLVTATLERFSGRVWDVRTDAVELGDGQVVTRDFIVHTGAVGAIVLDADDHVLLVRQYRHPVGALMWEPPAGLLDLADETPLECAQRELVEEAGLVAREWHTLVDLANSPGGSSEVFRCFLARDVSPAPDGRPEGHGEERDMPTVWVPLDRAVELVLGGRLNSPITVAGVLAAVAARATDWATLRLADADWPLRAQVLATSRARTFR